MLSPFIDPLLSVGNVESVYKNGIFAPLALKRLACVAGVKREAGGGGEGFGRAR